MVYPSPSYEECWFQLPEEGDASLEEMGVLPGSTVRFSSREDGEGKRSGATLKNSGRVVTRRRRKPRKH